MVRPVQEVLYGTFFRFIFTVGFKISYSEYSFVTQIVNWGFVRGWGNKGTLAKYRREHDPFFREQGNKTVRIRGRKHFDTRNKETYFWDFIYGHLCTSVICFVSFTQEIIDCSVLFSFLPSPFQRWLSFQFCSLCPLWGWQTSQGPRRGRGW